MSRFRTAVAPRGAFAVLLGMLLLLPACVEEEPSVTLAILDPASGQTGASLTTRLTLTGPVQSAAIKVFSLSMPSTPLRTGTCHETCTLQFELPSGTFEVQGFLTPQPKDGAAVPELASERFSVTIDSRPLTAILIPTVGNTLKVLFLRQVLAESITPDTVKVTRTVQTGANTGDTRDEPVAVTMSLTDRTLTLTGEIGAPALIRVAIDGVRDAPGNRCVVTHTATRPFFANGSDVREFINVGSLDRLRRDATGRLYHLAQNAAWRLEGAEWVPVATWNWSYEQDHDLAPGGGPVVAYNVFRDVYVPETGTTRTYRDLHVQHWDGSAMVELGGVLATTVNQPLGASLRVDAQGRPVLLVTTTETDGSNTVSLRRWSGTQWDTLAAKLNATRARGVLGAGGGGTGPVFVGWREADGSQTRTFLRRVESDGSLTPMDLPDAGVPHLESLTHDGSGSAVLVATEPGGVWPSRLLRRTASGWQSLGNPASPLPEVITSLTVDASGLPVVFTRRSDQNGSTVNDPGDPYGGSSPNVYVSLSGYRYDGLKWTPLAGAPHQILETQQVPWMSSAPADFRIGDSTVALAAHYLPDGKLWLLKLRGRIDFSTGGAGVARTYLLRASHTP